MITMVENEKSRGQQPDKPSIEIDAGFGSAAARFDKVEADMREGFARVDRSINGLRGEVNQLGEGLRTEMNIRFLALEGDFKSLQRTLIGSLVGSAGAIVAALIFL